MSPAPCGARLGFATGIDIIVANKIMRIVAQLNVSGTEGAFGENAHLTEEMQKASKLARAGKFDLIRPSHLGISPNDKGGASKPLQVIAEARNPLEAFRSFTTKLQSLIVKTHPSVAAQSIDFIERFTDVIVDAARKGVSWDDLTPFYRNIMEKITTKSRLFATAAAISPTPTFDMDWLDERSKQRCELNRAISDATIEAGLRKAKHDNRNSYPSNKIGDADKGGEHKKNGDGNARAAGVVAGQAAPLPKDKNDDARVRFRKDNPDGHVARKKKTMPPCWDFHHPQGCKRGEKCDFFHGA